MKEKNELFERLTEDVKKSIARNRMKTILYPFVSEDLYNAGYRKVPENVILLDFNTEAGTAFYTVMPRDEFVRNVSSRKAVEKNAVKEFAEKMKEKFEGYDATSYNGYEEGFHDLQEEIDELLKEYEDEKSRN